MTKPRRRKELDELPRKPVQSSNITSVGYDSDERILDVEFHAGAVYRYYGVSEAIFHGLMAASSKGSFFVSVIKPHLRYVKLS